LHSRIAHGSRGTRRRDDAADDIQGGNEMATAISRDVDQLNSFLRGELSAVETYDQAIEKLADEPQLAESLRDNRDSHARRAAMLRREIEKLGGEASDDSGVWGGFAKLVEGSAKLFGKKSAIAALEEGEDHGRDDYLAELREASPELRELVENELLPEQLRTHDVMSNLKRRH
jgi:uncharacterized protein (TIGR02284 family)